jgi:hypothetical protein
MQIPLGLPAIQIPAEAEAADLTMPIMAEAEARVLLWLDIEFKDDKKCRIFPAFFLNKHSEYLF